MRDRNFSRPQQQPPSRRGYFKRPRVLVALIFSLVLIGLSAAGRLPWGVLGVYATASILAFGLYGYDKLSAKTGRWRTPEKTLLTLGLIGGWPGALLAQEWIRHKSSKFAFQIVFWVTVAINCAVLTWLVIEAPEKVEAMLKMLMSQFS